MNIDELNERINKVAIIISSTDKNIRQPEVYMARKDYFENLLEELCDYWRIKAGATYVPPKLTTTLTYML
jgi:hypothetical protein